MAVVNISKKLVFISLKSLNSFAADTDYFESSEKSFHE